MPGYKRRGVAGAVRVEEGWSVAADDLRRLYVLPHPARASEKHLNGARKEGERASERASELVEQASERVIRRSGAASRATTGRVTSGSSSRSSAEDEEEQKPERRRGSLDGDGRRARARGR